MSTPQIIRCEVCQKEFVFLRGSLENCTNCNTEYKSHRDLKQDTVLEARLMAERSEKC